MVKHAYRQNENVERGAMLSKLEFKQRCDLPIDLSRWRHISCPAVGSTSQFRTASESSTVELLTHIRDCGAIFDRDRVHWSIHVENELKTHSNLDERTASASNRIDYESKQQKNCIWSSQSECF
jgi:hypothetical protein